VEESVTGLRDALADFRDDGYVTMDTFADMSETFGAFPDEFERFVSVASNSKSTMSEVKVAANELAEAYVNSTDFLANMTDGTIDATIATLKNIGVVNAEEVVMNRVAAAKAEDVLVSKGLEDAEWRLAKAHLRASGATEDEINALLQLRQVKIKSSVANTNFLSASAETVAALLREAKAAGMATDNLAALLELKNAADSGRFDGMLFAERTEMLNSIVAKVQRDVENLAKVDLGLEFNLTPTPGSGKSAAEKAAEEARDAFEKEYNARKHSLDMQRITIEEFYAWLDGPNGYKKYFQNYGETLEDFRKYEKEVFDGRKEMHEAHIQDLEHEIKLKERLVEQDNIASDIQATNENELIALYNQKRSALLAMKKTHEDYLRSTGVSESEIINNDDIQNLIEQIYDVEDAINNVHESVHDRISQSINDLIELTEDMIKQHAEDMIDALEKETDAYQEIIDTRKELLKMDQEESQYKDSIATKTKRLAEIEARSLELSRDDSREARLQEGALREEQAELQKELHNEQQEHYVSAQEKAYDNDAEEFEKLQQAKIDEIEEFLKDNKRLNQEALRQLDDMNEALFDKLLTYAETYTDTTREELVSMWDDASAAAEKYGSIVHASKVYADGNVDSQVQSIIRQMRENGSKWGSASKTEQDRLAADNEKLGADLGKLLQEDVYRDKNGVWWIGDKKLFEVYHSGTPSAGGKATLKQNELWAKLEEGETVLNRGKQAVVDKIFNFNFTETLTKFLYPLTQALAPVVERNLSGAGNQNVNVSYTANLTGNITDETMEILHNHSREVASMVSYELRRMR
jgi:hypothetical protein